MARACRVPLFRREVRLWLSSAAVEILFEHASMLSEGERDGDAYIGSTMLTIDLTEAADRVSEACDHTTTRELARLVTSDIRVARRAEQLALHEASARVGQPIRRAQVELRARRVGHCLHLDMDIEAELTIDEDTEDTQ
jgi:hypothetical protein